MSDMNYDNAWRSTAASMAQQQQQQQQQPQSHIQQLAQHDRQTAILSQRLMYQQASLARQHQMGAHQQQHKLYAYPATYPTANSYSSLVAQNTITERERQLLQHEQREIESMEQLRRHQQLSLLGNQHQFMGSSAPSARDHLAAPQYHSLLTQQQHGMRPSSPARANGIPAQAEPVALVNFEHQREGKKSSKISKKKKKVPPAKAGKSIEKGKKSKSTTAKEKSSTAKKAPPKDSSPSKTTNNYVRFGPTKCSIRYCWDQLELGTKYGTPAYNAFQRDEYERSGHSQEPPPKDITALELCKQIDALRPQSLYLPVDSPLQMFVEQKDLFTFDGSSDVEQPRDKKVAARGQKKQSQKKGKTKGGSEGSHTDRDSIDGKQSFKERMKDDHSTVLHHALGRLYHTICRQDADDYSKDRKMSNSWTVDLVKAKIKSFENEISRLEEREARLVKESKLLGNTDMNVMDEALTLLGIAPP